MSATWAARNPEAWRAYKREYRIKNAERVRETQRAWRTANKERINDARRDANAQWYRDNCERLAANELLRAAKKRAKASGLEFSITLADISIPTHCPLLDIPLRKGKGRLDGNSPSLDRRDNTRGYVPGNVWVISYRANAAKGDRTADELIQIGVRLKASLEAGVRS
jgi:hypothetical protein